MSFLNLFLNTYAQEIPRIIHSIFFFFADRIGANWLPEFHDFAVVFLSETLLKSEKALACLGRARTAFPNMVGIDLYNNLSSDMRNKAEQYCKRIFSPAEGKEFLLTTFPEIAAAFDLETKKINRVNRRRRLHISK